jgi:prepilin-type N-terminal cleavage/methylation domain-containing protein
VSRRGQGGFTLIEMMITLVIASLLVAMLLSIFARMSFAFREQQDIVAIQQTITAARTALERDAKLAGNQMAQGFKIASDGAGGSNLKHSPLRVVDSSTGPDEIGFYYADPNPAKQAVVTSTGAPTSITVDTAAGFAANDVVVLSTVDTTSMSNPVLPTTDAKIALYDACIVQIQSITGTTVTFFQNGNWGRSNNDHSANTSANTTMMYGFIAHYWRIDSLRPGTGALQLDTNGNLLGSSATTWTDEAYDFTDIQVSTYFYDGDGADTADPDTDGNRDWVSDGSQTTYTGTILKTASYLPPLELTISLVARTDRDVEGVFTAATPNLVGSPGGTTNNMVGNHASVTLPSATDTTLQGKRIYRYITFQVDLRNLGVGQ